MKVLLLFCLACLSPILAWSEEQPVVVSGSTTVYTMFFKEMETAMMANEVANRVLFRPQSSRQGLLDLLADKAKVAMISAPLHLLAKELPSDMADMVNGLHETRLLEEEIVVIAHSSNPVDHISAQELKKIYQANTARPLSWRTLGGPDTTIRPLLPNSGSATRTLFLSKIMDNLTPGSRVIAVSLTSNMVRAVAANPNAIGVVPLNFLASEEARHEVKVLKTDFQLQNHLSLIARHPGDPVIAQLMAYLKQNHLLPGKL